MRKYVQISATPAETVIVRQLSDGCAIPAATALSMNILAQTQPNPSPWLHQEQINAHQEFATAVEPELCFATDPLNQAFWLRSRDYIPLDNAAAAGIQATVQSVRVQNMLSGVTFMRIRFKAPTTPVTPCTSGCSLTGDEQLRYLSLSFQAGSATLFSISDASLIRDPNGYVTIIVGMGAALPAVVTASNYYTFVDLTKVANYQTLTTLFLRNIIPNATFACSTFNVPYFTTEINPSGGYMGEYVPTVDYPKGSQIPTIPVPVVRAADSCTKPVTADPIKCTIP